MEYMRRISFEAEFFKLAEVYGRHEAGAALRKVAEAETIPGIVNGEGYYERNLRNLKAELLKEPPWSVGLSSCVIDAANTLREELWGNDIPTQDIERILAYVTAPITEWGDCPDSYKTFPWTKEDEEHFERTFGKGPK